MVLYCQCLFESYNRLISELAGKQNVNALDVGGLILYHIIQPFRRPKYDKGKIFGVSSHKMNVYVMVNSPKDTKGSG